MGAKVFKDHYENRSGLLWVKKGHGARWAYSDGESVERALFEAVATCSDPSVLSSELRERIVDWPTLYYFSPRRANLMRPFAGMLAGRRVLEIGAGCGALSHFLADASEELVALEPSLDRARVAAERCRFLTNVKVVVDDLESFSETGETFDAITLIGVLEYAHRFSDRADAPVHWLRLARSMLRPGGVLFLAIENKLGLKYFAGAPEDHLGRPMYGVSDLYTTDGPRTFGLNELKRMLQKSGFGSVGTAIPLPDYKLPTSVLLSQGDDAMPGFDGGAALAAASVHQDRDLAGLPLFAMDRTWKTLSENGLLVDMANSFLMIAHNGNVTGELVYGNDNVDVSAYHYSVDRLQPYCKEATFVRTAQGGAVKRRLIGAEFSGLDEHYICRPVDECYVPGQLWSSALYQCLSREGWHLDDVQIWFDQWVAAISGAFPGCLDETCKGINWLDSMLPGESIDFVPQNLVHTAQGEFRFIDFEWRSSSEISLGFLLFRGLYLSLSAALPVGRPADMSLLSFPVLIQRLLACHGASHDQIADSLIGWFEQENAFQLAVRGGKNGVKLEDFMSARLALALLSGMEGTAGRLVSEAAEVKKELMHLRQVHENLDRDHASVAAWALKLDEKISELSISYRSLQEDHAEKIAWAKALDAELVQARQLLTESRDRYEVLQAEHNQVAVWGQSLDREVVHLRNELSDAHKAIEGLDHQVRTLSERIRAKEQEMAERLDANEKVLEERTLWAQSLDARLNQVMASRSWKLTRPLRLVARVLRGDIRGALASVATHPVTHSPVLRPLRWAAEACLRRKDPAGAERTGKGGRGGE